MPSHICSINLWGSGSGYSCSSAKTKETKVIDDKFKKMMAERSKQDTMWSTPSHADTESKQSTLVKKE